MRFLGGALHRAQADSGSAHGSAAHTGKPLGWGRLRKGLETLGKTPGTCGWYPMHLANGIQCMGQGVQLILDPLQGAPNSVRTVQYINSQCVRVKLHREWALDTGGIVPGERCQHESFNHRRLGTGMRKQAGVRWLGTGSATSGSMGKWFFCISHTPKAHSRHSGD